MLKKKGKVLFHHSTIFEQERPFSAEEAVPCPVVIKMMQPCNNALLPVAGSQISFCYFSGLCDSILHSIINEPAGTFLLWRSATPHVQCMAFLRKPCGTT